MPSILKVKILNARDLPVMDRSTELTDAFVVCCFGFLFRPYSQEIRFADLEPHRTAVARQTLNPSWNEDFRFEVATDADLQNEPLELKVLDYDYVSSGMVHDHLLSTLPTHYKRRRYRIGFD